jgi:hypothetical protein
MSILPLAYYYAFVIAIITYMLFHIVCFFFVHIVPSKQLDPFKTAPSLITLFDKQTINLFLAAHWLFASVKQITKIIKCLKPVVFPVPVIPASLDTM